MDVDNNAISYNLLLVYFFGIAVVCWFQLAFCLYLKITGSQLQYHEIDDTVDDVSEDGDAEDILHQLKISMKTKDHHKYTSPRSK